jgi:hypothetical protein
MDGWMDGWMDDGWMDGWTDEEIHIGGWREELMDEKK